MMQSEATWWRGHPHGRRPISRWRRGLGLIVLVVISVTGMTYWNLTDEARLRVFAERWLERFTGGEARIEAVQFSLFRGLDLVGVTVALPASVHFDPHDDSLTSRTVFTCSTLYLRLRPLSIVSGDLVVPEIVAADPDIRLVHRTSDGLRNWQALFANRRPRRAASSDGPRQLPVIRLRNVRLRQYRLDERGHAGGAAQTLWADAQPVPGRPEAYDLFITKLIDAPGGAALTAEAGRLEIDMNTLAVAGSLPTMTIEDLLLAASPELAHWLDVLALRGYVRPDTFAYDPGARGQAKLTLREAGFSIPLDQREADLPPEERYVQFDEMEGTIAFDRDQAEVALTGRFRDSRLEVAGRLQLGGGDAVGLDALGLELTLTASGVSLPRNDADTDPAEVRFVTRWPRLQKFVYEYDGDGRADLALQLHKSPGPGTGIEFVEGTLTAKGTSGRYFKFPYRVDDMTGTVRFRADGMAEIVDLAGTHGEGTVVVNALVGAYTSQFADVNIHGRNISLDDDLLRCLSPADQALCRQFNARARLDLSVSLKREAAPHHEENKPWTNTVEVTFTDGSVSYERFPYPLDRLAGRMRIERGGFRLDGLTARRGDAVVTLEGTAERREQGSARLDLTLNARGVPLDDALRDALPDDARGRYGGLSPAGRAEVSGRIFTPADGGPVTYDLDTSLDELAFNLPGSSARLDQANAALRITPGRIAVQSLQGAFQDSRVSLQADVAVGPADSAVSVRLRSDALVLDDALRDALPPALQRTWETFQPAGRVGVDLLYERDGVAGGAEPAVDYAAVIEPRDCTVTFAGFPLPLTQVSGRLMVTPGRVVVEDTTARHEEMALAFSGRIDRRAEYTDVELSLSARHVTFPEALRQAVPWRLRRLWNDVKPRGTADLVFDRLAFTAGPDRMTDWELEGTAVLDDVSLTVGTDLSGMRGKLHGKLKIGPPVSVEGRLELTAAEVDGRRVNDFTAVLSRPASSPVFRIGRMNGRFYDGQIVGWAEVDYAPDVPTYGLSLTARGVSLGAFLNARRPPEKKPLEIEGQVEGNLVLAGRFGEKGSRRGGGSVVIREAQMLKVPLLLAILQVIHLAIDDDNAFHDAVLSFMLDGEELILEEIDLRGKALSMVGSGRVHTPTQGLDLTLLVGSPLKLPRLEVLSELLEGVAREIIEVRVGGTLDEPEFRADVVRSLRKTLEVILSARRKSDPRRGG